MDIRRIINNTEKKNLNYTIEYEAQIKLEITQEIYNYLIENVPIIGFESVLYNNNYRFVNCDYQEKYALDRQRFCVYKFGKVIPIEFTSAIEIDLKLEDISNLNFNNLTTTKIRTVFEKKTVLMFKKKKCPIRIGVEDNIDDTGGR
ncbi:MAG: hypothetical protein ACE1ZQ_00150 [Ignavibacteriaceae bacterium]